MHLRSIFIIFWVFLKCSYCVDLKDVVVKNKLSFINDFRMKGKLRSDRCGLDLEELVSASVSGKDWALQMLDASAKLPSGLLMGNIVELGHYDECLAVKGKSSHGNLITGQHCMVYVALSGLTNGTDNTAVEIDRIRRIKRDGALARGNFDDLPNIFSLGFGFCVPSSCSVQQLKHYFEKQLSSLGINADQLQLNVMCTTSDPIPFNTADWVAITVFGIFGVLLICSTGYDVYLRNKSKTAAHPVMLAFSMYTNGERLLAINPPSGKGENISCIHGLRALSISWVVIAHRYDFGIEQPLINLLHVKDWIAQYHSAIITGSSVSVDTFFVLSGILLSFIFLKHMSSGKRRFNLFSFYFHRYLRLTPPYAAIILLQATLLMRMADGPLWNKTMPMFTKFCTDYFWSALLYIQTAYNSTEICVVHSWYLSADMQMYIISPLILLPMLKWPKHFVAGTVLLLLASIGVDFGITYVNNYSGSISEMDTFGGGDQIQYLYFPTYARYGPWLAGILAGYALHNTKRREFKLKPTLVLAIWLLVLATLGAIVFGAHPFYQLGRGHNTLEASFYQGFSRLCWGLGICWIVWACSMGYGGPINWFLSWGFWQPLSRLSYCIYLTHYEIQLLLTHSAKTQGYFSEIYMLHAFVGDMGFAVCVSVLWSLAFESPVTVIEKIMQGQNKPERRKNEQVNNNEIKEECGIENLAYEHNPTDTVHVECKN